MLVFAKGLALPLITVLLFAACQAVPPTLALAASAQLVAPPTWERGSAQPSPCPERSRQDGPLGLVPQLEPIPSSNNRAVRSERECIASGVVETPAGDALHYAVFSAPVVYFPGPVDSNSPAIWVGEDLVVFNSASFPMRSAGPSLDSFGELLDVECVKCDRPGGWWLEAVWKEPETGTLFGWYHLEPAEFECLTAPSIGTVVSHDGGVTWQDRGAVLENGYPIDCNYQNGYFVGGNGDFSVVLDQQRQFFYFLFSNYGGPIEEQGIGIARSRFDDRGQPGAVVKYYQGSWSEPGIGGRVTPLLSTATGWEGPIVDAFWGPSIHWNAYLEKYVALLNRTAGTDWMQEGVYLTISDDLLSWSEPQKILDSYSWYPQVMGLDPGGSDAYAGKMARLYIGGVSAYILEFSKPAELAPSSGVSLAPLAAP